ERAVPAAPRSQHGDTYTHARQHTSDSCEFGSYFLVSRYLGADLTQPSDDVASDDFVRGAPSARLWRGACVCRLLALDGRQHVDRVQPGFDALRPRRHRQLRTPQSVSMPSPSVEVDLNRHASVLQSQIVDSRILHVDRIILCLHDERWWRLLRHMDLRIGREVLFRKRQISRINDNGEV